MAGMWSLGGLSLRELLRRTVRESWDDNVFGQAAQLAFYHFLAIFPVLLLLLIPLTRLAQAGTEMRHTLMGSFRQFLPQEAAGLVSGAMQDLEANARQGGALLIVAALGAMWAGVNASWAMISGLNTAYEITEDRGWRRVALTAIGLGCASVALVFAALSVTEVIGRGLGGMAEPNGFAIIEKWIAILIVLLSSFALFYRFGPNLKSRQWQWSTPGAAFGVLLWVASTLLVREYFDRFGTYQQIYGRVASSAVLMIWLYVTSATVLIGAELNSEIEKAAEKSRPDSADRTTPPRKKGRS